MPRNKSDNGEGGRYGSCSAKEKTDQLPYLGCVWWILILLLFLLAVGWGYLALADRIGRKMK